MKRAACSSTRADPHRIAARRREPEHRALPGVLAADLGDRELEAVAHALRDRAHDAALLLERLGAVDVELDGGRPDDHSSVAARSSRT